MALFRKKWKEYQISSPYSFSLAAPKYFFVIYSSIYAPYVSWLRIKIVFSLMILTPTLILRLSASSGNSRVCYWRPLSSLAAIYRDKCPTSYCGRSAKVLLSISIIDLHQRSPSCVPVVSLPFLPPSLAATSFPKAVSFIAKGRRNRESQTDFA